MVTPSGGQSIDFYLITTGLPIDPNEGTLSKYYYDIIVNAIGLQADILIQNDVRTINNIDVNSFLPGYNNSLRNCYQFLIGVAGYSDPFNRESLIKAIQTYALVEAHPHLGWNKPKVNDYSFNAISTLDVDNEFNIWRGVSGSWATQKFNAFYSDRLPTVEDGYSGSIWIVNINGQLQFFYNDSIQGWGPISNYGTVTYTAMTPPEVDGDWWINPNGFNFSQFNGTTWGSNISYLFSQYAPVTGSYWLTNINAYTLEVKHLINSIWEPIKLSRSCVKQQVDNSNFLNEYTAPNAYNYTVDIEPSSLYGGPIVSGSSTMTIMTYNQAIAVGGVNELFTSFYTHLPIAGTIEVFVNGELQDPAGVIITGQNLQFIDSVNGFTLNAGDDIVSFYEYTT